MNNSADENEVTVRCPHCQKRLDTDVFLSLQQLARRWGVNPKTLYNWRSAGVDLRPVKICGRLLRFAMSEIVVIERNRQGKEEV